MARVTIFPSCNADVAHLPGVIAAVAAKAAEGAARATAILEAHHHGPAPHSFIDVTHGKTDSFVNLNDPGGAAAAVEFGRLEGGHGTTRGVGAITGAF